MVYQVFTCGMIYQFMQMMRSAKVLNSIFSNFRIEITYNKESEFSFANAIFFREYSDDLR